MHQLYMKTKLKSKLTAQSQNAHRRECQQKIITYYPHPIFSEINMKIL